MMDKVFMQSWHLLIDESINDLAMLIETAQVVHVDILQLIVYQEDLKQPEGNVLIRMVEQSGSDEVHSLDVSSVLVSLA
jgi:hypothetical protein